MDADVVAFRAHPPGPIGSAVASELRLSLRWLDACKNARRNWAGAPVVYSYSDCGPAILEIVHHATGIDPLADVRGRYHDPAGARAYLKQHGGSLRACIGRICKRHGWPRIDPGQVCGPTIGIMSALDGPTLVAFDLTNWFGRAPMGFAVVKNPKIHVAWEIR